MKVNRFKLSSGGWTDLGLKIGGGRRGGSSSSISVKHPVCKERGRMEIGDRDKRRVVRLAPVWDGGGCRCIARHRHSIFGQCAPMAGFPSATKGLLLINVIFLITQCFLRDYPSYANRKRKIYYIGSPRVEPLAHTHIG